MVIVTSNNNLKENKKPIQEMIFLDKLRRIGSSDLNLKFISNKFNKLSRFVTWKLFDYPEFKEKVDFLFGYYILKSRLLIRILYPIRYKKRISSFCEQGFA